MRPEEKSPPTPRSARILRFFPETFQEPKIQDFRQGMDGFIKSADEEYQASLAGSDPYQALEVIETQINHLKARIYREKSSELRGCILYFTGSAFLYSTSAWQKRNCMELTRLTGFVTINIEEPCPPEHPFPAGLEAAFSVLEKMYNNPDEFGIDKNNISLCGFSSGGGMATALAHMARDRKIPIQRHIILAGFLNPSELVDGPGLSKDFLQWAVKQYVPDPTQLQNPSVSPLLANDFSNIAPATIVVGEYDPLHAQCLAYYEKLKKAGVEAEFYSLPKKIHEIFGPYGFFLIGQKDENPIEMAVRSLIRNQSKESSSKPKQEFF